MNLNLVCFVLKPVEIKKSPKVDLTSTKLPTTTVKAETEAKTSTQSSHDESSSQLWVEKYKPKSMNKIIGQLGEKSNANKLLNWLRNWNK